MNDVELSTKNDDQRYSIDNSVASFDLVRMLVGNLKTNNAPVQDRSTKILPFLALMALGIVSLISIIQLFSSNTIVGGTATFWYGINSSTKDYCSKKDIQ